MISLIPLLCLLSPIVAGLDANKSLHSILHEMRLNNSASVLSALEAMPKECTKNGKKYNAGDEFEVGHLRYKCRDYGVYSMEGCIANGTKRMNPGESFVENHIKYQCMKHGSSIFYRETTCGILGQPECDNVPLPTGFQKALEHEKENPPMVGSTRINGVELPKGWKLIGEGSKPIPSTNASVITQILMFQPTRAKRDGFSTNGVGRVIAVEDMSRGDASRNAPDVKKSGARPLRIGTDHDVDLIDLDSRRDTRLKNASKFKAGSVRGQKSSVDWNGRKVMVNGKTIGVGPGTFTFGNRPTSSS
ncbi:unnamed protein product [Caenorhabditis bovis]|uniref:Abnormal cell migration protein 18-like fibronectin type I domain-containing protein n=1 Tax=Caenorhabditis bovis TaxID=2654633 RepID=A0A8S1F102_9PELO|nr:unnamed protein product [Caenorhabditis bovis]